MRNTRTLLCLLTFAAATLCAGPVTGDTIFLKDGREITGRIVSESKTDVVVERGSIQASIPRKDIEKIEYESGPPGESGAADPAKLLEEARRLYSEGSFEEAARRCERILRNSGSSGEAESLAELCRTLADASNSLKKTELKEAKEAANAALALDEKNEHAARILGEIGKYDKELEENGSLSGKFLVRDTRRFRIYHHQPYLASEVAVKAEEYLDSLTEALTCEKDPRPVFKERFEIRIYRDSGEYKEATGKLGRLFHSMTTSQTEIATYQGAALGDLKHELTHLLVHRILPSMPVWVHEGLATGGYKRAASNVYTNAISRITGKKFLPFDDFLKIRTPDDMGMSVGDFYLQSHMAVEFLIFGKGGMEKFHRFAKRSREILVRDVNAWAKTQKKTQVKVRNIDWIEKPMREMLAEIYGYADLKGFDADLKEYVEHRASEAAWQEQHRAKELDAEWEFTLRLDSEHFAIFTTSDKSVAEPLLELAEKLYEVFWLEFADTKMFIPGRVKIYLFDKVSEYISFLNAHGHDIDPKAELVNPHFSPFSGAACVCREKISRDFLHQSTAHEIAHGLSISLMSAFSGGNYWVVEGIAHYIGMSVYSKTQDMTFGNIHQTKTSAHVEFLELMMKKEAIKPLKEFISLGYTDFRKDFIYNNVECWSLFHFLQHADDGKYRDGFHRYLAEICGGKKPDAETFEKHIGKLPAVEQEYREYIKTLKATTRTR